MPQNADRISEIHTTVDENGAIHYCYSGTSSGQVVTYYGRQKTWSQFDESVLQVGGSPLSCGAIAVTSEGRAVILARNMQSLAYQVDGGWQSVPLDGLSGVEAKGALNGSRAVISLSPDDNGGVYLGLSLGFELGNQGVYLARFAGGSLEIIGNGWEESGDHTVTGHAPQFFANGSMLMMGSPMSNVMTLLDGSLGNLDSIEGVFHRVGSNQFGDAAVLYMDNNYRLRLDGVVGTELASLADLGPVEPDPSSDGQLPWDLAIDEDGTAHLLIQDQAQGYASLVYRQAKVNGTVGDPVIVSENLADDLPGMQKYALGTDMCGRATVVTTESDEENGGVKLRIVEGR